MTYSIFEGNMDRLKNKLTRIKNKCQRYGCDFHFEEVGEEFRELEDERKHKYIARFVIVDVDGLAVINDWKFVAAVEHTENGNVIRSTGEVEVPEKYYTSQPVCEHCGINRYRKDTYIVMNVKTGEFKQVGKSCLNDFTRGMSAESAAQYTSLFNELIEGETPTEGCAYEKYYDVGRFLRYAAETVRHFGYVKYDPDDVYARTTKIRAEEYYDVDSEVFMSEEKRKSLVNEMESVGFNADSKEANETVKLALDTISTQSEDNNYIHNLKTICGLHYVTYRDLGILASLIPFAEGVRLREMREKDEKSSQHIGNIKERITVDARSVQCVTSWDTEYGVTRIYKIVDVNGNIFTWKTGNVIDDDAAKIVGTVKAHNEYRGIKQTELTRCQVLGDKS